MTTVTACFLWVFGFFALCCSVAAVAEWTDLSDHPWIREHDKIVAARWTLMAVFFWGLVGVILV